MINYLWVFLGGGLGSICRYGIAHVMLAYKLTFPWATLLANIMSCIVLGIMIGLTVQNNTNLTGRLLIMTGFCGGFSTFSTFTYETFALFKDGYTTFAFANIIGSLLVCLVSIYVGIKITS